VVVRSYTLSRLDAVSGSRLGAAAVSKPAAAALPPIPNACDILNLRLGPVNLDLLGLVVRTNQLASALNAILALVPRTG
jgi:hypothetical protein